MNYKNVVITHILFSAMAGHSAWAQETYDITHGVHIWDTDKIINGVSGWPGSGFRADGDLTAHISSAGNIDASHNHSGAFFSNNASVTISGTGSGNTFSSNSNGWEGILVESGADLTLNDMDVKVNGNADNGIRADSGGSVNINDASVIELGNNNSRGIFSINNGSLVNISGKDDNSSFLSVSDNNSGSGWASGIWSENNARISISNINAEVARNGLSGIMLWDNGSLNISGDGRQYLHVNENAIDRDGGIIVKGKSNLDISGMDVQINNNGLIGLQVAEDSVANISGDAHIQNSITADGNVSTGFASMGLDSVLSINNMNVQANANGGYGLSASDGGVISLVSNGSHMLNVLGNVLTAENAWTYGAGILANGLNAINQSASSTVNIAGMDINVQENDSYGVRATQGGVINISGLNDNKFNVVANNRTDANAGNGIVADFVASNGTRSIVNIKDMDIQVDEQSYQGIAARDGGLVTIASSGGTNTLEVYNTRLITAQGDDYGKGIHAQGAEGNSGYVSTIIIEDMNINSSKNELEGLVAADSGIISVESHSGNHSLVANQNQQYETGASDSWAYGAGILAHGISAATPGQQAAIIIKNMNVEANENGLYGLYARDGGVISIAGNGAHTLGITGNKSTVAHTYDAGIAIEGLISGATSKAPAAVEISNMEVTINDNGRYGIDVVSGGQMVVSSSFGNNLTVSGNETGDSLKNEGAGINVAGVFDGTQSQLDIIDMNVLVDSSPDAGIKASDGAQINIASQTGTKILKANNNNNYGTQYNEGAGLFALDSGSSDRATATINVTGMNIEAKNNGSYGILSEGGLISIQGDGSHQVDVDGNGRYGVLAKDGGSINLYGVNVSGDSLDHSLVGIERDGLIHFTHSTIETDNDALFYTWSDSYTQKSEFILDSSTAKGNGQLLAQFNAHDSILNASQSYLVNAIVTDDAMGASSTVSLDNSVWRMKNSSNVTELSVNSSLVDLRHSTGHNTLTVGGNYSGNNSALVINTVLGNDHSPTDKLIVGGNTSGTTTVVVNNAGGSGDKTLNGIEVITVEGRSDGEFVQSGRIVAGSYEYTLGRGNGDNNSHWYLTNTHTGATADAAIFRPEMGSYLANKAAANAMFNMRLHDRIGDTQYTDWLTGEEKITSMWLRQIGGHTRFDTAEGQLQTQSNRYVAQLGGDLAQWSRDGLDRWHLGMMVGYGNNQSNTESNISHFRSRGQVTGYSAGLYGTWYANEEDKTGTYLDSWVLYSWFNNKVSGQGLVSEKYRSDGFTASVEGGYSYLTGQSSTGRDSYWLQPKAQLTWMDVRADNHTEYNGTRVKDTGGGNLQTRLGVRAYIKGHHTIDDGNSREFQPFVEANWIHNSRSYGITMSDVTRYQEGARNLGELKTGVEGQLNKNLQLWGNVAVQVGSKGYSDTQGILGMKYSF